MRKYIKSALAKYRYFILAAITIFMAVEMGMAFGGFIPVKYESLTAWALCTTIVAWIGISGLIGAVSPVDYQAVKYLYLLIGVLVLLIAELTILVTFVLAAGLLDIFDPPVFEGISVLEGISLVTVLFWVCIALVCLSTFFMRRPTGRSVLNKLGTSIASARQKWTLNLVTRHVVMVAMWTLNLLKRHAVIVAISILGSILVWGLWLYPSIPLIYVCAASMVFVFARPNRMQKTFSLLVVFPLILFTWIGLCSMFLTTTYTPRYWLITAIFLLVPCVAIASLTLQSKKMRVPVTLLVPRPLLLYLVALGFLVVLLPLLAPFALALLLVQLPALPLLLLLSLSVTKVLNRIWHPYRSIVSAAIGLCAVIGIAGWYWTETITDGLSAFTGQERVVAKEVLREAHCDDAISNPLPARVIKDSTGEFRVLGYTWWGFSSNAPSCGLYRQGNRW